MAEEAEKAAWAAAQLSEAKGERPMVTCECGLTATIRFLFRCLYCGIWRCQSCSEIHFGKTREQYNAERHNAESGDKNCQVVADEDDDERIVESQNEWCDDCRSYTHRAGNPCGASLLASNVELTGRGTNDE